MPSKDSDTPPPPPVTKPTPAEIKAQLPKFPPNLVIREGDSPNEVTREGD